jgi:hypothetical protein
MMQETTFPPDLLRRFSSTPYIFDVCFDQQCTQIQSNDLDIALAARSFCRRRGNENVPIASFWKLIRDRTVHGGISETLIVVNGPIRMLHAGKGTVLTYDGERSELFGFVARDMDTRHLVAILIPTLIGM